MKLLPRIFNRLNVLHIRFGSNGEPEAELVPCVVKKGKVETGETRPLPNPGSEKELLRKAPLVVAVSGKGVITKDSSAGSIVDTIMADPGTFVWTKSATGNISFVRRGQLEKTLGELANAGITPIYTECLPDGGGATLVGVAAGFYSERLGWKTVLKPSAEGSQLASMLTKRIQLPVLGIVLFALLVNFMLSPSIRADFQRANTELAALRKSTSSAAESSGRRQAALEQFSRGAPFRFSWLSDRIAAATPEKVVLDELSLFPVTKNIEAGKPVQQNEHTVMIRGETLLPESIAYFVKSLGELGAGTVKLSSVEQDRERGILTFRIEIWL